LFTQPLIVGWSAVFMVMASIGITSLMSGTAATDFGGRKATATCMGIINAFAYLGSSLQSFCIGYMVPEKNGDAYQVVPHLGIARNWDWLPIFVIPFALIGLGVAVKIWHDLPEATRRYISTVEKKDTPILP
jgi:OPA family glycerol-3-phosphate transporter-like MFS transporter